MPFKQKLICLYDFDLQDDHKTPSKYLLCITQNKNLITCFISSRYPPLTSPKINYNGCNETYLPKCLHSLLVRIIKTLTQQSSQVSALILSTNSHIKSIHHFSYLWFTAFYYRRCCWSSQAVPNYRQRGFLSEHVFEFCLSQELVNYAMFNQLFFMRQMLLPWNSAATFPAFSYDRKKLPVEPIMGILFISIGVLTR